VPGVVQHDRPGQRRAREQGGAAAVPPALHLEEEEEPPEGEEPVADGEHLSRADAAGGDGSVRALAAVDLAV
jgi:hypothetical protein